MGGLDILSQSGAIAGQIASAEIGDTTYLKLKGDVYLEGDIIVASEEYGEEGGRVIITPVGISILEGNLTGEGYVFLNAFSGGSIWLANSNGNTAVTIEPDSQGDGQISIFQQEPLGITFLP
ncbi:MAG: hypothetical protein OXN15_03820 [Chloroflexota bacterium]|nr:hypothetical protein [Chloroflexota bacterium]